MKTRLMMAGALALAMAGLAGAGDFQLDPAHSRIGFAIGHLGISTVKGNFTNFTGRLQYVKDDMPGLKAEAVIQAASVDTGVEARDKHLRTKDFFDAAAFPEIRFTSGKVEKDGDAWVLTGSFTMHGVTKEVRLKAVVKGPVADPMGGERVGLHAEGKVNRQDYGVGSDKPTDKMVGDEVTLEIDLEAKKS